MSHWLSRRTPRYIRSLVYMLQTSEYNIPDFLIWHKRTRDFRTVEKRKRLVFTQKAIALFAFGWTVTTLGIIGALLAFFYLTSPWSYIVGAVVLLELPLIVLLSSIGAVFAMRIIQRPLEGLFLARTKRHLASHKAIKIAISGSFGKTSMREILKVVLSEDKRVAAPKDSHNTPLAIARFVQGLKGDEDVLIFELGEYYPGDVRKLAEVIKPQWGFITGVNEAHLLKFKTLDRTADTIFELAEFVKPTQLYVNGESHLAREHAQNGNVLYTSAGAGRWSARDAKTGLSGTTFNLTDGSATLNVNSKLLGLHMVPALTAAADIASQMGLTHEQIERGLAKTKPFTHRLESTQRGDGVTFIDDSYNGNPDGVRAAIAFLASLNGRRFYVTPGLVETGLRVKEVHEKIGLELAQASIEKIVLIRTSVVPHIETGLKAGNFRGEILFHDDMPSALAALRALSLPGDIILVQNDWPDQYA